jgi:anthranilate phosphoribosyltransferase
VTSASGSSDILKHLGVNIDATPEQSRTALEQCNLCFLFAPLYHQAMRHVVHVRQELGLRTIFNLLGPLANPARTKRQLLGVYDARWLRPLAEVLHALGVEKAWVVHGCDGMDEITTTDNTQVVELDGGMFREFTITPEEMGIERAMASALQGGMPEENAAALWEVLAGKPGAYRDIVILNTAAALMVADRCSSMTEGCDMARQAIDSGTASDTLLRFIVATGGAP